MPQIPELWTAPIDVGASSITTDGVTVTQLANGNLIVVYASLQADGTTDIRGQLYDPLGNPIGGETVLSEAGAGNDAMLPGVAPLGEDGFVISYVVQPTGGTAADRAVVATEWTTSSAGPDTATTLTVEEAATNGDSFHGTEVEELPDGGYVVGYRMSATNGTFPILFRTVDDSGTVSDAHSVLANNTRGDNLDVEMEVQDNGQIVFATAFQPGRGSNGRLAYELVEQDGTSVLTRTFATGGDDEFDVAIRVLENGNVGISYTRKPKGDNDVDLFQFILDDTGATVGVIRGIGGTGGGDRNVNSVSAALQGGEQVIFYSDADSGNGGILFGQRVGADGVNIGDKFVVAEQVNEARSIDAVGLEDGRLLVVYENNSGLLTTVIYDPRDTPNDPGVYVDPTIIGTANGDDIAPVGLVRLLHAHDGDDTIHATRDRVDYHGDAGNDTLLVLAAASGSRFFGDSGLDTIDWSAMPSDSWTIDMATGLATAASGLRMELSGFETLIGTTSDDVVTGSNAGDSIHGIDGDDTIDGGKGPDHLFGGDGSDSLSGGGDADTIEGGADDDVIDGGLGADVLFGDGGNDLMLGGDFSDLMYGGAGNDTLRGENGADTLIGGDGADQLTGGGNTDSLVGGAGNDTLRGNLGNDTLIGEAGNDSAIGGDGRDSIDGGIGNDTLVGNKADDTIIGGDGNDSLLGGDDDDLLRGGTGADTIEGGNGADFLFGDAGNDTLIGGAGSDVFVFGLQSDTDQIADFSVGEDLINLAQLGITSFTDLSPALVEVGGDTILNLSTVGGSGVVVVEGVTGLTGDDFIFDELGFHLPESLLGF
ncbi:calcium-binding protein [Salipiger sp.]|uniref:calcium-binding protein n=1 Tax=Salipiger sp. TaxID=2078585 RepID=UPI003A96D60F